MSDTSVAVRGVSLTAMRARRDPAAAGVPVAASTALHPALTGAPQPAVVVGTPTGAVYLRTASGELLAVLVPGAARLPMGAVVGDRDALRRRPGPGQRGYVGAGRIDAGCLSAYVVRWWDPRPALPRPRAGVLAANLGGGQALSGRREAVQALAAALRDNTQAAMSDAVRGLVGLGSGLTPSGDDVLIGLVSALVCLGHPDAGRVTGCVQRAAADRTTDLSLALLWHASLGQCIGEVGHLLRALSGVGDLPAAHRRLLAVGHSSGGALCLGVLLGAEAVARAAQHR